MVKYIPDGNIVNDDAELLVNTVNTVGAMGKGVAEAFKTKWPSIMPPYLAVCNNGRLQAGHCLLFNLPDGRQWAALATKKHWYNNSRLEWVVSGLKQLARLARKAGIKSIAIPPPGCGNGGLDWKTVEPLVLKYLGDFDLRIYAASTRKQKVEKKVAPTIMLADKLYVPRSMVNQNLVRKTYEKFVYNEKMCAKCDHKPQRFDPHVCGACPGFLKRVILHGDAEIKGREYITIPAGNLDKVEEKLGLDLSNVKDLRPVKPFKNKIKFIGKLREGEEVDGVATVNQKRIVSKFIKSGGQGMIIAKTRSGKTVIGIRLSVYYKERTIIIANKDRLLKQFMTNLYKTTNIKELEKQTGRRIAGIVNKDKDFTEIEDIVCITYQKLIQAYGAKRLKEFVAKNFGTVIIDEADQAAAECFSGVVHNIAARKIGLTASKDRKDGCSWVYEDIIGPIQVEGENVKLRPEFHIIETKLKPKSEPKQYVYAMKWLSDNHERNKMLVRKAFEILRKNPKRNVLIPVVRVDHCLELTKMLNQQAKLNNAKRGEDWHETRFAVAYYGKQSKAGKAENDQILKYVEKGKGTRVTVGMRTMVKRGVDIPSWTDLLYCFMFSNPSECDQLLSRVSTPAANKPQPRVWAFVDDMGLSYGCFRTSFLKTVVPDKYLMTRETKELAYKIVGGKKKSYDMGDGLGDRSTLIGIWN